MKSRRFQSAAGRRKWLCRVSPAICLRANPDQGRREDEPDRLLVLGWRVRRISYGLVGAAAGEIAKVRNVFQPCGVFFAAELSIGFQAQRSLHLTDRKAHPKLW